MSRNWITSARFDLLWYVAASLTGYALVYAHLGLGVSALLLFWFWIVSVDGPHVFGTLSRTYLDAEEWRTRAPLLLGSLLWFLAGPAALTASLAGDSRLPFLTFLTLAQLWAYWHVVRQHYGFMVLYQKKNGEAAGKANPIDYWVFYLLMLAPFASFLLRHPEARPQLGLGANLSAAEEQAVLLLHLSTLGGILLYFGKEAWRVARGEAFNLPKNLFLLSAVSLHLFIFLHPYVSTRVDIRLFAVFVTYYHNIQYHGIVWFHNRNRYRDDERGERYGWASRVSRNFLTYYAVGILFTLAYRYSNWYVVGLPVPLLPGPNALSQLPLGSLFTVSDLAIGFWWGFAFNHYYLDQKIWRVSRDPKLRGDLGLPALERA